ncbi:hypothetical protein [Hyphomicrobium sp. CS1GBMeth3]|uniref:hypothetical protein n=1 Tax=Hyphomicrobium sp. CS1GBMeth3 TaxID=1892845 RepID=UPI000A791D09|nr:hypothetical protein [Hyphomicrobium sp. CS1GBMeth3]
MSPRKPAKERRSRKGIKVFLPSLAQLDRRTRAAQLVFERRSRLISDLGGEDRLSCAQIALIEKAAVMDTWLEATSAAWLKGEPLDVSSYTTTVNALNRTLQLLGLRRQPKDVTPDLKSYLASKAAVAADQAAA